MQFECSRPRGVACGLWGRVFPWMVAVAAAGMALSPAPVAAGVEAAPVAVTAMKPGEFLWQPERAPQGELVVAVSIPEQRLYAWRDGVLVGVSTVSTGKRGHATPTGVFPILQKNARHFSNLYNNAPMPFMQRLTWDGIALHAGALPGYPASHGCVRLPLAFAKALFGATRMGAVVVVTDRRLAHPQTAEAPMAAPFDARTGLALAVPAMPQTQVADAGSPERGG